MKRTIALLFGTGLAFAVAGCGYTESKPTLNPSFGNAVRHNMTVQILNPEPRADTSPTDLDGKRASDAVERYREGKTKAVVREATSDVGSGTR